MSALTHSCRLRRRFILGRRSPARDRPVEDPLRLLHGATQVIATKALRVDPVGVHVDQDRRRRRLAGQRADLRDSCSRANPTSRSA
jgi:hypothetical protein